MTFVGYKTNGEFYMNDITDSIQAHLPAMVPNSFIWLDGSSQNEMITGLLGDKNGTIWLIEMCRETGKIHKKIRQGVRE